MINKQIKKVFLNNWPALLILVLTWLIFFSRTLTTKLVYYLDDLKIIYYPLEWSYAQFQSSGNLPFWSNLFGFGHPLLAWGQLGFFTPLHLLLRVFSIHPLTLLQISIISYFAIGSLGMFIFLRRQNISPPSAALGAILFTYSGFHIGHLSHVNFYTTTMLLPWLLLLLYNLSLKPSLFSSILITIVSASMALSGQPQVVLYSFLIAAAWFIITFLKSNQRRRLSLYILIIGLLAFSLASFAILPLIEFLPSTDRAHGLSMSELLEFSYPPHYAITLILPYFFGDHYYYWGAKSLQELAAYIGVIPLFLIGTAPLYLRSHRSLKIFGLILILGGIIFSLGRFSPIYSWLVANEIIKSISIPGRFAFMFIVGSSILATTGLESILQSSLKRKTISLASSLFFLTILFAPFFSYLRSSPNVFNHFISSIELNRIEPILILLGIIVFLALIFLPQHYAKKIRLSYILVALTSFTLIVYGWNFNPLTAKNIAYETSPLVSVLEDYNQTNTIPPRIYQIEHSSVSARRRTEPISYKLTVYQPIISRNNSLSCFTIPFRLTNDLSRDAITINLTDNFFNNPLRTTTIKPDQLSGSKFEVCFEPYAITPKEKLFLSFTSSGNSGVRLIHQPTDKENLRAYFFRVANPTPYQIEKSQKPISILFNEHNSNITDQESQKLSRHLNATADSSSPNWVGALAISSFRKFSSSLLADDADPAHYNSQIIINDQRSIIDLAGITHIIESALTDVNSDYLVSAGFQRQAQYDYNNTSLRLYTNPSSYPKAWLGKNAVFSPVADETINSMRQSNFDPQSLIYISGPTPPKQLTTNESLPIQGSATITKYDSTAIDINVSANQLSWLVVTDSTTPQWKTYIDGKLAPQYTAFATFKAAQVPSGEHKVSFRYESPAINLAYKLTNTALLVILVLIVLSAIKAPRTPIITKTKKLSTF